MVARRILALVVSIYAMVLEQLVRAGARYAVRKTLGI